MKTQKARNGTPRITGSMRFANGSANTNRANGTISHSRERRPRYVLDHRRLQEVGEDQREPLVPRIRSSTEIRSSLTCERPVVPGP